MDPKFLIEQFFDPINMLYCDIEMVMQAMSVSAVKHSCESILESFVSQYENHFDDRRNVSEITANEEFEIAVNGPGIGHAESVIVDAMNLHFQNKPWHFFRTSPIEKLIHPAGSSTILKKFSVQK